MLRTFRRSVATVAAAAPLLVVLAPPAHAAGPTLSIGDLVVTETNAVQTKTVTVKLSAKSASTVTVKVATANGTATTPADYTAVPLTTLTFSPGQVSKTVPVKVAGDVLDEADETFRLVLSSPLRATIARSTGTVTVRDDDAAPGLTVAGATMPEGSAGLADRAVTLSLTAVSGRAVTVAWETVGGTATSGVDYEPAAGTVTIPAGTTSKPIPLSVDGDTADEPDERFYVRLVSVLNATPSATYHRVVLTDDDLPRTPVLDPLVPAAGSAPTVSLAGAADPDNTLRVYAAAACAGAPVVTAAASRLGSGGVAVPVTANGTNTYTASALSPRGEASGCSNAVTYAHTTPPPPPPPPAPAAPVLDEFAPAVGSATTVMLYGLADDDTTLRVYPAFDCGTKDFVAYAASRLAVGIPLSVDPEAESAFSARAVSADGVESECSNTVTYQHVTPVPATPVLDPLVPAAGTAPYVTLFGSADGDATVLVYATAACGGDPLYAATGSRLGAGGVTVPVEENVTTAFSARAVSPAGPQSSCSNTVTYTNDSIAPAAPVVTVPAGPANDNTPTVTGTAEAGSKVSLYRGGTCDGDVLGTVTAAAFAGTGLSPSVADDTTTVFSARAKDAAGNVSPCGAGGAYVEDSTAPVVSAVSFPGSGVGAAKVSGTVEAGGTVSAVVASADAAHTCGATLVSGITQAQFAAGASVPMTLKQVNWVRLLATDTAGNTTACAAAPVYGYSELTTETEPDNNATATADAGVTLPNTNVEHYGSVGAIGDVDYYRVNINETGTQFVAETYAPPNASITCASNKLDTKFTLYDAAGTLIAQDDDAGEGFCSRLARNNLAAGVYYLAVSHTNAFSHTSLTYPIPYRVAMGYATPASVTEAEPNDQFAQATNLGTFGGLGLDGVGAISTVPDVDVYAFTMNATRQTVVEVFDTGDGACAADQLDSRIALYGSGGSLIAGPDDDAGLGLCSKITVASLPAGSYSVVVERSQFAAADHTFSYRLGVR